MQKNLALLPVGQSATVCENKATGSMRRRLLDIGLVEGTRVTCLFQSPGGDPVAYRIRGAVIAIRKKDGATIVAVPLEQGCATGCGEQVWD